ncbi:Transcription termination protein NusB [Lachnospiraceae bacterium TWA4]|nr:Transcription termination protein NusB [Lachnospiraceae bacterium TWA4]
MTRRERRECLFKMLFQQEFFQTEELKGQQELFLQDMELREKQESELTDYVNKIIKVLPEIDEKINQTAKGWKTSRMSKVDLTLLRLAIYEIAYDESVPNKVAINEAVELCKIYGGNDSSSFVNGILGKLVRDIEGK